MRLFVSALALLAASGPALAQDPSEDWDLTVNAERQLTLATLDFGDNILALRCQAGTLDLLLTGVPVSTGALRTAHVTIGAVANEEQVWAARPGQPVIGADEPARLARQLRAGGDLDLRLQPEPGTEGVRRYRLTAPASAAAVDAVLTACGEPLDEPRDLLVRVPLEPAPTWLIQPRPIWPAAATAGEGAVEVSCVVSADWGLADCRAEGEAPAGQGFAAAALASTAAARIAPPADGTDVRGRILRFTVRLNRPS
jgi:hypothetical protein